MQPTSPKRDHESQSADSRLLPEQSGRMPDGMPVRLSIDQLPLPTLLLDGRGRIVEAGSQALALLSCPTHAAADPWSLLKSLTRHDRCRLAEALEPGSQVAAGRLDKLQIGLGGHGIRSVDASWCRVDLGESGHHVLLQLIERSADFPGGRDQDLMLCLLDCSHYGIQAFDLEGHCLYAN
ncbi:MAG: hypothetical protein RLZZ555_87, partial [Pseudomonadota bacterium]